MNRECAPGQRCVIPLPKVSFAVYARWLSCAPDRSLRPHSGHLPDRIGRKPWYLIGAVAMAIFGFIYFAMPNSLVPSLIFLGIMLSFMTHGILDGPQAASIAECFTPRLRYIAALDRLSSCLDYVRRTRALIATALLAWTGSGYAIACYIAACTAVSIIATMLMPDHTNQYISQEHARPR